MVKIRWFAQHCVGDAEKLVHFGIAHRDPLSDAYYFAENAANVDLKRQFVVQACPNLIGFVVRIDPGSHFALIRHKTAAILDCNPFIDLSQFLKAEQQAVQRVQNIFNSQSAVQLGEGARISLEHYDFLRAKIPEVLHLLLKLIDFQVIFLLLPLQKLSELLLLLLRVCVLEGNTGDEVVMRGVCAPLVNGELLGEEVAGSGRFCLAVERCLTHFEKKNK
jgi:hypothetical protein